MTKTKRGGRRTPKKLTAGSSRVLSALWQKHGGITVVSKKLGVHFQNLIAWKLRGEVPFKRVGEVSRLFNIDKYLLNYNKCSNFTGKTPDWNELVDKSTFSEDIKGWIKKGSAPKLPLKQSKIWLE